jgi:diamine N-acetyltransferase
VIAHVRARPNAKALATSVVPGEGSPGPFYETFGFAYTGEIEDGERVMRLVL